ncbi:MAG: hypothetical protein A3J38_03635 [Gammaproteobacteria bacterium RIFCSPHIGHO2_12_FULL_45_9]|nr:MAG: hypothetical protein A3J38_03635 [Gammaproteobacteria bacterium RIFCSPHIGHO2_12_FULL_45_9]
MRRIGMNAHGLGLRDEHITALCQQPKRTDIDFLELAPENWMNIGGTKRANLECIAERYPLIAHGLSLSIADTQPLNVEFLQQIRAFLDRYHIEIYSEHLSFSRDSQGYLYDLLPVPRHADNIAYIAERIRQAQDILQRPLVLENISYYHRYPDELAEAEFLTRLVEQSQCELLLDINNVYVNSQNHGYIPNDLICALQSKSIRYYHIAGHLVCDDGQLLDTHGKAVSPAVLALAQFTFQQHGTRPLLLERDHHLPTLETLCAELNTISQAVGEKNA